MLFLLLVIEKIEISVLEIKITENKNVTNILPKKYLRNVNDYGEFVIKMNFFCYVYNDLYIHLKFVSFSQWVKRFYEF